MSAEPDVNNAPPAPNVVLKPIRFQLPANSNLSATIVANLMCPGMAASGIPITFFNCPRGFMTSYYPTPADFEAIRLAAGFLSARFCGLEIFAHWFHQTNQLRLGALQSQLSIDLCAVNLYIGKWTFPVPAGTKGDLEVPVPSKLVAKPKNSWILYRASKHEEVQAQNPTVKPANLSTIISKMWKEETEEVKEHFEHLAYIERERHAAQFPGWKCTPRKPKDIKRRAKKENSLKIIRATAPPTLRLPTPPKPSAKLLKNSIKVGISISGSTLLSIPLSGGVTNVTRRLQNAPTFNGICDNDLPARDLSWVDTFEDDCRQITQDAAEMGRAIEVQCQETQDSNAKTQADLSAHLDNLASEINNIAPGAHSEIVDASGNVREDIKDSGKFVAFTSYF